MGMAYPIFEVRDRRIILLSGYDTGDARGQRESRSQSPGEADQVRVFDWDRLVEATLANRDAVAFGYTAGKWVAAA